MKFPITRVPSTIFLLFEVVLFGSAFSLLKSSLPEVSLVWGDEYLSRIDRFVSGGRDAWDLLFFLRDPISVKIVDYIYGLGWFLIIYLISTIASFCCLPLRHRYFFALFLTLVIQGLFIPVLLFSGGPAFFGVFTGDFDHFEKISQFLEISSFSSFSAHNAQTWLLNCYLAGRDQIGAGISAFPSVHVALACLAWLFTSYIHLLLSVIMAAFCAIIMIGSVLLGWHYAIDGYFAIALELTIWWLCGLFIAADEKDASALTQFGVERKTRCD